MPCPLRRLAAKRAGTSYQLDWLESLAPAILILGAISAACDVFTVFEGGGLRDGQAFRPTRSVTLEGGVHRVKSVDVPKGVKVRFTGALDLTVEEDMTVSGAIMADCQALYFNVGGQLNMVGQINNECTSQTGEAAGIHIRADAAPASASSPEAEIVSSGDVSIVVGPEREAWEYDLAPDMRPAETMAPVCSAAAGREKADVMVAHFLRSRL